MVKVFCPKCGRLGYMLEKWAVRKQYRYFYVHHRDGKSPQSCYLNQILAKKLIKLLEKKGEEVLELKGGWELFQYKSGVVEWRFKPLTTRLRSRRAHCVSCRYARPRGRRAQYCMIQSEIFITPDSEACEFYVSTKSSVVTTQNVL